MIFQFDYDAFEQLGKNLKKEYAAAQPFPHAVIDNFLPESVANRLLTLFPKVDSKAFVNRSTNYQPGKYGSVNSRNLRHAPPFVRHFLHQLNSPAVLYFLSELTGIEWLLPDPYFQGGGLHQIVHGGSLNVHADFNFKEHINLYRRINLLIYLNKDWQEEYGGYLELWDKGMTQRVQNIAPVFNRCVIFSTSSTSFHGHPVALNVPEGITRKSIAVYYYTRYPAPENEAIHGTLWQKLP